MSDKFLLVPTPMKLGTDGPFELSIHWDTNSLRSQDQNWKATSFRSTLQTNKCSKFQRALPTLFDSSQSQNKKKNFMHKNSASPKFVQLSEKQNHHIGSFPKSKKKIGKIAAAQ